MNFRKCLITYVLALAACAQIQNDSTIADKSGPYNQQFITHIISVFTKVGPIRACDLAALDAYTRHTPSVPTKIYIIPPEGSCRRLWDSDYRFMLEQIKFFVDRGLKADVILIEDITPWIVNTPLQGRVKHRNLSGMCGKQPHKYTAPHGSDLFRMLATYHLGGIYKDADFAFLTDIGLYLKRFGTHFFLGDQEANRTENQPMTSAVFGTSSRGLIADSGIHQLANTIDRHGLEQVAPSRKTMFDSVMWAIIGPPIYDKARHELLEVGCHELCTHNVTGLIADYDTHKAISLEQLLSEFNESEYPINPILQTDCDIYLNRVPKPPRNSFNVSKSYAIASSDAECYEKLPPYAAVMRKYHHVINEAALFTPIQWYDESPLGLNHNFYTPEDPQKKLQKLKQAIGYHWFGADKRLWPDYIERTDYNPLIKVLRDKSCNYLCTKEAFDSLAG